MTTATIGIDIGKNWFHLVGLDSRGVIIARHRFNRVQLIRFIGKLQPCVVGMEASCGSHHLARELTDIQIDAQLMSAKFVRPFLKRVTRTTTLTRRRLPRSQHAFFVPIKTIEQLDLQAIHRARSGLISRRTGVINRIRSFLQDRGIVVPQGPAFLARALPALMTADETRLSNSIKRLILTLQEQWLAINQQVDRLEIRAPCDRRARRCLQKTWHRSQRWA